jgi:hypothetical protein
MRLLAKQVYLFIYLWFRCKITNRCVKELVNLLLYSVLTPTCFNEWLPSSKGRWCLIRHSSLLEWLIRHQRPHEDGNHLPKHVGVNLEYSNRSTSSLTHLLVILQRYDKMLGPTIKLFVVYLATFRAAQSWWRHTYGRKICW